MENWNRVKKCATAVIMCVFPMVIIGQDMHSQMMHHHMQMATPLTEPGNDVFGTIQEAIRALEADSTTDWSKVDLEALRQHLIDMNNFTMHVDVVSKKPIPDGVDIIVKAQSLEADQSLQRVLKAHPPMLKRETGWTMQVKPLDGEYELVVTTPNPAEVEKIRALGYIGLLAYGMHHQMHHWMIVNGMNPHSMHH